VLAKKNKTYAVRQFLETHDWVNPDLYKVTDGRTALHDTAFKGNAGICECLLEFKADVNCQKTTGWYESVCVCVCMCYECTTGIK
jgi:ankyrin repeat protein